MSKGCVAMYNFFVDESKRQGNFYLITDDDYNHIKNVLRMKIGDEFLVSENNVSNLCRIESFEGECIIAEIIEERFQDTSLPVKIYLFQFLLCSDFNILDFSFIRKVQANIFLITG